MKDLLSYREVACRLDYKDTGIVRKLVKQGVFTPVYLTEGGRPRIHAAQWMSYVEQLNPEVTPDEPIDIQQAQRDLLALMNPKRAKHDL